jgi:O-antigen/teichoic acid export membrane protein
MDKRRFLINLISNALNALSGIAITLFLTPYIVKTLGVEAYGFFPLTSNLLSFAGIFTMALNSMSGRYITISLEQRNIREVNVYFNSILWGNIGLSILFLLMGAIMISFIQLWLDIPASLFEDVRLLFVLILGSLCINVSSTIFSVSAFALSRFDKQALINIFGSLVRLSMILLLFWAFVPRIYFLGIAALIAAIYYAIQNYRLTKRLIPEIVIGRHFFSWTALSLLLTSGIWNSLTAFSNVVNTQLDLFIANRFFGAMDMGMLSLTKLAPILLQVLFGVVVPIFLPDLIKLYAKNDMSILKKELDFSFKSIFIFALLPISVFFIYGQEFFKLWVPTQDSRTLYLLSVITLIPFLIHATIETVHNVFIVTDKIKIAAIWGMLISIGNFVLTLALCEFTEFGIYAIPLSALITGIFSHLTFTPLYAAKCLNESLFYFYKPILKGGGNFLILLLVLFLWKYINLIPTDTWLLLGINCLIVTFIGLLLLFYLHLDKQLRQSVIHVLLRKIR